MSVDEIEAAVITYIKTGFTTRCSKHLYYLAVYMTMITNSIVST